MKIYIDTDQSLIGKRVIIARAGDTIPQIRGIYWPAYLEIGGKFFNVRILRRIYNSAGRKLDPPQNELCL